MENKLKDVRDLYRDQGCPSIEVVAERANLSRSTTQRYLSGMVKAPDLTKIIALERALGRDSGDIAAEVASPEVVHKIEDPDQLRTLILQMHEISSDELETANKGWRARLDAADRAHREELVRMSESHNAQLLHMQDVKRAQIEQMQTVHVEQMDMIRQLAATQKEADEKSKDYLRRQVLLWRIIAFVIFIVLLTLVTFDLVNPDRGYFYFVGRE